ncbi:hypothetical protein TWF694_008904 [Orbilia ellipsospora]|uniref:Cyanovirin-N domain-containing protein n=1 Tax=Orbilia ellipsospora TaxID=2528407 RepID=A0AAV9XG17_9PEZI
MKVSSYASPAFRLTLLGFTASVQAGGFLSSCTSIGYYPSLGDKPVGASCRTSDGHYLYSEANTMSYIGNINGILKAHSGGYGASCQNCGVNPSNPSLYYLICQCNGPNGWATTHIDLNLYLSNKNGNLAWDP